MEVSVEKLVVLILKEVLRELKKQDITITGISNVDQVNRKGNDLRTKVEKIDMSKYVTPIITENHIQQLHELTGEIIIPKSTIITPKAIELIREKKLAVTKE